MMVAAGAVLLLMLPPASPASRAVEPPGAGCGPPALLAGGEQHAARNTAALQASLDSCARAGGGAVTVPPGAFSVGCVQLRSDVELALGVTYSTFATLLASTNASLYSRDCDSLLYSSATASGQRLANVSLTGHGVIDGTAASATDGLLVKLVHLSNITGLLLDAVTVQNSPSWHVHLQGCDDVTVTDVTIRGPEGRAETDGLDLDTCHRVYVSRVDIGTGDDAIAIKSSGGGVTSDVLIEHSTLRRKEMAFGSSADCRNVTVRHSAIGWGLYIKLHREEVKEPGQSVVTQAVLVEDVWTFERPWPHWSDTYQPCALAINLNYPCPTNLSAYHTPEYCTNSSLAPVPRTPPKVANVTIRGVRGPAFCGGSFTGLAQSPIEGLVVSDVAFDSPPPLWGWRCSHVVGAVFERVVPEPPPSCVAARGG